MELSEQGAAFIKRWESCRLTPYQDVAGFWTVGIGHLMQPSDPHLPVTQDEADALFDSDVIVYCDAVNEAVPGLWQPAFDAAVSLAFNIGTGAFTQSTLVKYMQAGQWSDAGIEWLTWRRAGGKPVDGLLRRRASEVILFARGEYV